MNYLHLAYKQETGHEVTEWDLGLVRSHGEWILDPQEVNDDFVLQDLTGYSGRIMIPDLDYIAWLEEKVKESELNRPENNEQRNSQGRC